MNNRWLYREVHEVELQRKPARRATHSTTKPARNWKYRSWIRSLPCAACGCDKFIEAAHTGSDGGFGQKSSDHSCVPLCAICHRVGPRSYHIIGKSEFETLWQLDFAKLAERLITLWRRGRDNWD